MRYAGLCVCSRPAWTCGVCGARVCYVADRARRIARDPVDHAPHVCPPLDPGPVGEERFASPKPQPKPRPAPVRGVRL